MNTRSTAASRAGLIRIAAGICLIFGDQMSSAQPAIRVKSTNSPSVEGGNASYVGNRAPLVPSPLMPLPVGSIKPQGWLQHQLRLMADGFSGHLTEISKWCNIDGNAWVSPTGEGQWGWEEVPYWLRGFIELGYVLGDRRIIDESGRWVEGVLSSQDSSGYFGPRRNKRQPDLWPNMVMLYVLRTRYEATGDRRILPFMTSYCRWLTTIPLDRYLPDSWQKWRGGDNLDHILWLYNRTGERWLLDLARVNHERTADWTGGIPTWHGVNLCQGFREPAEFYQATGDVRYLKATERNYADMMNAYGQVPGGMFGADENARPGYTGPRQGAETCSMVEFMHSDEMLVRITGDPVWADRAEEIAFNSLPASMTPDLKGLHYLTAANMVQLDRTDKAPLVENDGDMFSFNPYQYRCCQHNVAFGWPYFAARLWMATQGDGLAAVFYAPSTVRAKVGVADSVTITETTEYPFGESVEFRISSSREVEFPLTLRVPSWSKDTRVSVNGKHVSVEPGGPGWITLTTPWKNGDIVRLEMPMQISVREWSKNNHAISVDRGPLTYSLRIGERWERYGGTDAWPASEVYASTPWNYGLVVDGENPASSFTVVRNEGSHALQPFAPETVPVRLTAKVRRIPGWTQEPNGLVGGLQASPVRTDSPEETITLIPMGAARLRITAFPRISTCKDGNVWK